MLLILGQKNLIIENQQFFRRLGVGVQVDASKNQLKIDF